jgi:hypothetical protein
VPDSANPLRPVFSGLKSRMAASAGAVALVALLAGCGSPLEQAAVTCTAGSPSVTPAPSPPAAAPPAGSDDAIVGNVVRFTSANTSVDVTIGEDNPATRDFLSTLPLTIGLEEYAGREKISYLPREPELRGISGIGPRERRPHLLHAVGKPRVLLQHLRRRLFRPDAPHRHLRCVARPAQSSRRRQRHGTDRRIAEVIGDGRW